MPGKTHTAVTKKVRDLFHTGLSVPVDKLKTPEYNTRCHAPPASGPACGLTPAAEGGGVAVVMAVGC